MSSGLTLLCLVVLFEAESFIIVVHLKPDWPPQAPVDVQQPLEDEHSVFLHTRAATHAETDNNHQRSGSQGGDILLAACHGGSVSGVRAGPGARSIHRGEAFHDGETPIRWELPFYFKSTGVKSRLTGQAEEKWNIFSGSRTGRWKNSNFEPVRLLLRMVDVFNVRCKNKNKIK